METYLYMIVVMHISNLHIIRHVNMLNPIVKARMCLSETEVIMSWRP